MTIAAGIVCADGILICADSEVSYAPSKRQREKVYPFENHLLLTGSGNGDFIKMAFDKLCDEYKNSRPVNPSDARQVLETLVLKMYQEHIFSFYQTNDPERPSLNLIVASRCKDGRLALVRTRDTAAILVDRYEATGSGEDLFEYWARLFYRSTLTMDLMSYLTLFILREVKRNVMGCGGESHIVWMPKDESVKIVSRFFSEDMILAGFPDRVVQILVECRDLGVDDKRLERDLEKFVEAVNAVRQAEKQKIGMGKFIREKQADQAVQPPKTEE
ncbi:MAG: hypothetical protein ACRD5K_01735 [Candidatus Acidiferrales bacterium]